MKDIIYSGKILLNAFFLSISLFIFSSCQEKNCDDPLDEVASWYPSDKYFKSALVSLHFFMEVSPVEDVDRYFYQLVENYKLPVNPSSAAEGIFTGSSPWDAFDYRHICRLEIKDGKIIDIDYNEVHKNGTGKEEDEEYCLEMAAAGTRPDIAYPFMESQLIKKQDIMQVDGVSGATYSLYRFRYAATIALMKAELAAAGK